MKIGVCITTIERPVFLEKCVKSLTDSKFDEMVIVNNGARDKIKEIRVRHRCDVIDGKGGSGPQGQNLGFEHLMSKGCELILKADDDLEFDPKYIDILTHTFNKYWDTTAIVGGSCWSHHHPEVISRRGDGKWYADRNVPVNGDAIGMCRIRSDKILLMNHLHGSFLYSVDCAFRLRERTKFIRKGVFAEYLSKVAHREETEFSLCMKQLMEKNLLLNSHAVCFHHYAPGGIRLNANWGRLQSNDNALFNTVMGKLNVSTILDPACYGVI